MAEKIQAAYTHFRDKFTKNRENLGNDLRQVVKEKQGTNFQLNILFAIVMKKMGFQGDVVMLSTRANGKIHPVYPIAKKFNYFLTFVNDGEKEYLLDPSTRDLPFGMIPEKCVNGWGMLVTDIGYKQIPLQAGKDILSASGRFDLTEDGRIKGTLAKNYMGYQALNIREEIKEEGVDRYKEKMIDDTENFDISLIDYKGLDEATDKVEEQIEVEITGASQSMGNIIYLSPILDEGYDENPFKLKERSYPVDFGAEIKEILSFQINLPEGYEVDELPQPMAIAMPGNSARFVYNITQLGNSLNVISQILINKGEFLPEEYPYIKEFFDQIVSKQKEQVVLKKVSK